MFRQDSKSKVLVLIAKTFSTSRPLIDINETARKHAEILLSLIDTHAIFGCDSVPKLYGTGKKTVTKHLKDQNMSLSNLGDTAGSLQMFMPKVQNWFHHIMVSRIRINYLKYDSQFEENEPYLLLQRTSDSMSYVPTIKFASGTVAYSQILGKWACVMLNTLLKDQGQSCSLSEFLVIHIYLIRNLTLKMKKHNY